MMMNPPKYNEQKEHADKLEITKEHLDRMKQEVVTRLKKLHQSQVDSLKNTQHHENSLFSVVKNLETINMGEIHKKQLTQQCEIKQLEMMRSKQAWKVEKKRYIKLFEQNAVLSKKNSRTSQLLKEKRKNEKDALQKDQEMQLKCLKDIERKEHQNTPNLEINYVRIYHTELVNLQTKHSLEEIEFLFEKM